MAEILYDYHGKPLPNILIEKIRKSKEGAEKYPKREIKCPVCGIHLATVYGKSPEVFISVKCQKCKMNDVPLSMAMFRAMKK